MGALRPPVLVFHDIVSGNNGAFAAGMGCDLVTGLGSPMANRLVPALISFP
jgi:kumamolisin